MQLKISGSNNKYENATVNQLLIGNQDEMTDAVKRGMLKGFLELDEKLRKIPEVSFNNHH